jgi:hypothetical protein
MRLGYINTHLTHHLTHAKRIVCGSGGMTQWPCDKEDEKRRIFRFGKTWNGNLTVSPDDEWYFARPQLLESDLEWV